MSVQLPFPFTPPPPPERVGPWADLGRWMMGDGPEPVELAAVLVAKRHRERVRAAGGGR